MKAKEKDEIMEQFKNGEIQILISTTVIEVGVNVPNASIMVVENAERFGLAQLHQLRGRVGRGEYQSYCILKFEGNGKTTKERMKVMCQTNDGFIISEKDLELRGSGDFFGTEQHGIPEFKIANLFEDMGTLKKVQKIAMEIMEDDPLLEKEKNITLGLYKNIRCESGSAILKIAASGFYRVFVNGKFTYFGPARCAHGYYRVDEIELNLIKGENRTAQRQQ